MKAMCKGCKNAGDMDSYFNGYCPRCVEMAGKRIIAESAAAQARGEGAFWRGWAAAVLFAISGHEGA